MKVYGMSGCIGTKPGGTAEALIGFCPSRITEAGAFFIRKITNPITLSLHCFPYNVC
jgi:hypothetical protein